MSWIFAIKINEGRNSMDTEASRTKWQSLVDTWNIAKPPATPSRDDIFVYQKFISDAMRDTSINTVLLLGCTPSLRLLMAQMNITVTCVDVNQDMITKTTAILADAVANESYVCQDWLQMDLHECQFPIIIGDKVFDNIPYNSWDTFKNRLLSHLLPGGSLIIRVAPQDPLLLGCTFSELLSKWVTSYEQKEVSVREAASGLWEQALGASTKTMPGKQTISAFITEIESLNEKIDQMPESMRAILREFGQLFGHSISHEWTSYTLGNVIDSLSEELKLISIECAKDYVVAVRQPILRFIMN
jgi:2-polyprenyl-3-methyl-5-hydroxy-6-metoxy-1,4-benzoquinol methylase